MRQPKLIRRIIFFLALVLPPTAGSAIQIHVSPSGSDDNPGTQEAPLATLNAARDTLRQASADHVLEETATVWIHDGVYALTETFSLSQEDGGTPGAIVQYRAIHPRKVRLAGGRQISADAFEEVTDATTLERLPDPSRESVRRVDLDGLGIEDLGVYPDSFRNAQPLPELFFNGEQMTLAQWPNEGWAEIDEVIESGPAPWRNHESDSLGVFTYKEDHPASWAKVKDLWLEGYWCFDWAAETIRVKSVDPETRQITLSKHHVYGLGSGNPAARRYRAVNLLEELDAAGEYFIDREGKALYFWPPSSLENAEVVLSLLREPLIEVRNASNVQFTGLVLEYGAGQGMKVTDGAHVTIAGCEIRNIGQLGLSIEGGSNHTVQSCDIHRNGTGGIHISGGDRKTLTPSGHRVDNCDIHRVSERMRTAAYNIWVRGVGVAMTHNHIHDAPHQAIGLGGNDHLFEFNDVHHVGMASDDCGAFYMGRNPSDRGTVIRHNYWHEIGS
ncbi:MAG: right-handed parallel beta-helix repeat-containing protein, partial [Candidatus Omnitrophica bacterium]|nr:right-handed parallel beta-helix repeat-containing protein [Candidatus Omnitrophota bacterium]